MMFEQFSQGSSFLHRRDTRVKLISAICLTLVLALCQNYRTALLGLGLGILLVCMARLETRQVFYRLLIVNSFVGFLWITLPLTYPGTTLYFIGPLSFSSEGITLATLITIKTNAIILTLIALLATSTTAELGHSLERLGVPVKLCLLLLFSYRYIFVINQEYQRLARAARLRCFRPGTNLHTYRTFGYLFGMTLVKSCHRADRVRQAMMLRGFQGRFLCLNKSMIARSDLFFLGATGMSALCLSVFEFYLR
jgi:cobalt/nickel transport system permease protein